ncbi:MAG: ATP-binding cassette domain-containing protein, partial [Alicyclobacillus macrosporangiidus]|uniref:ABC transporter permease subunit n=1 Tax=Alicyclobacillus macrosporangiidus TaxID=392015 RepID=UPI0026EF79BE
MKRAMEANVQRLGWSQLYRAAPIAFVLLASVFPLVTSDYWIDVGTTILTYAMLGLGLNIVVGFAGLLDLGYAAFFAIGAYTSALLITKAGFNLWDTLPFAMILTAGAGAILGYPTLRLRSDYLAIVTLGFGEIVRITATNLGFTGGPDGIWGIPKPTLFGIHLTDNASLFYLALVLLIITLLFTHTLTRSRLGRAWLSLREDESASEAVGVPSIRVKLLAYVLGATWAGLAGAFFASRLGAINPQSFTYMQSVLILMVVVLGGMASAPGVLLGAAVVAGLPELLRGMQNWRLFVFAVGLIVLMLVRPQGLWPAPRRRENPFARIPSAELDAVTPESLVHRNRAGSAAGAADTSGIGDAAVAVTACGPSEVDDAILEVSHLECRFGGIRAVADVSFRIPRGSIVSIIGPNGAGKTTIFNCVTGVIRPQGGQV